MLLGQYLAGDDLLSRALSEVLVNRSKGATSRCDGWVRRAVVLLSERAFRGARVPYFVSLLEGSFIVLSSGLPTHHRSPAC